jgi:cation diffusion facilitator CzcD-associated flavoprotein CzcO
MPGTSETRAAGHETSTGFGAIIAGAGFAGMYMQHRLRT